MRTSVRCKHIFVLTTCLDRDDKEDYLSNIKSQCDEDGCSDALARPDLDIVDVLVSPQGGKSSVSDETEESCEFYAGTGSPDAIEDGIGSISKTVNKEGKGDERKKRKDERFPGDA